MRNAPQTVLYRLKNAARPLWQILHAPTRAGSALQNLQAEEIVLLKARERDAYKPSIFAVINASFSNVVIS